ncbi:DUF833-domain-containing protein [Phlegmacium glaucopus]|nr:DUF833-domain-containing protein [Phlegmacium glaucopus]
MCIGIWTLEHPDYALILCTNRDEFLDRPTLNAQFHLFGVEADDPHQVLSGRDGLAGGTWFGINRTGRVALLTNITEPSKHYNTSRGDLVSSFLLSNSEYPLEDQVCKLVPGDAKFAGFNLLLLTPTTRQVNSGGSTISYESLLVTNHGGGGPLTSRTLSSSERSCGALSNGIDGAGANLWPKVQHATESFPALVESRSPDPTDAQLIQDLFQLLAWQPQDCIISQRSDLRRTLQVIPVPISTVSGDLPPPAIYGTRLSTALLVRKNGKVIFIERDVWKLADGGVPVRSDPPTERRFDFELELDIKPSTECH